MQIPQCPPCPHSPELSAAATRSPSALPALSQNSFVRAVPTSCCLAGSPVRLPLPGDNHLPLAPGTRPVCCTGWGAPSGSVGTGGPGREKPHRLRVGRSMPGAVPCHSATRCVRVPNRTSSLAPLLPGSGHGPPQPPRAMTRAAAAPRTWKTPADWPTFAALFLLTLLYSGFVTFIKVRQPAHLCAGLGGGGALPGGGHTGASPGSLVGAGGMCSCRGPWTWARGLSGIRGPSPLPQHSGQEAGTLHLLTRTWGSGPCHLGTWLLTSPLCTLRPPAPFPTPGLLLQMK